MKRKLFSALTFAFLFTTLSTTSIAQTQPNSIFVTPSIFNIDLATDAPQYELTYENSTKYIVNLALRVQDFTELEEGYKLSYLQEKDAKNYKYSLSSWISFENPNLEISPGEKRSVKVFIDKDRITKGGHYASILAQITQPEQNKNVNVKGILSSLLFVRASTGKEFEEGKINFFSPLRDGFELPDSFAVGFENSGNVYVDPHGLLEIYDPLGNRVEKGILNSDSLQVLPESIRRFDIPLTKFTNVLIPGFYKAKIDIHFGKTNTKLSQSTAFFSYGIFDSWKLFAVVLIIVLIIYFRKKRNKTGR